MGIDTHGKIKGFIKPEDIFDFIKQHYDKHATTNITATILCPLSECDWKYQINEHSMDNENWYEISGFINFKDDEKRRMLYYRYTNINSFENSAYYTKHGLKDMVESETTYLSLGCWGNSVDIIKNLIAYFGGGWLDENDCDEKEYHYVESKKITN